jgi:restriction system protein
MNNNEDPTSSTPVADRKCLLVRSDPTLVQKNRVGHGWEVNFKEFDSAHDLIRHIGDRIGRKANQIARFKSIKRGDIIAVPVPNGVVLGEALGVQHFEPTETAKHCANQQEVQFFNPRGNLQEIPRTKLPGRIQSRLKIQQSVVDLAEFKSEIIGYLEQLQAGKVPDAQSDFDESAISLKEAVKIELLKNICEGRTKLAAGGKGLEKLVAELLKIDGFTVIPLSTRVFSGSHADADIEAKKVVTLGDSIELTSNKYLIQVKHHAGNSPVHGIEQLIEIKNTTKGKAIYSDHELIFITTGEVTDETKQRGEDNDISIMDGKGLVDWILNSCGQLEAKTKAELGITDLPRLLSY